jgi:PAS domain-containing protein
LNGTIRFSKAIPKAAREQEEAPQRLSSAVGTVGFLLFDSTLGPTFVNDEAIRILAYPSNQEETPRLEEFLEGMIRSLDLKPHGTCIDFCGRD